jgi:hypothetical protein
MSLNKKKRPVQNARQSRRGKAADLADWLERERPEVIGDREWEQLQTLLAPVSENYLRRLLRESGASLAPLIAGVRQDSLDAMEASLMKLLDEYEQGDHERRARIRRSVITAKDHARWTLRRSEDRKAEKQEMILWMTTWLENPTLFREWVRLRRVAIS